MVRPSGDCVGPTTNVPAYANGGLTGVDHGIRWSNRVNWHLVRKSTHAPKEFIRTISTKGVNARQSTHLLALGAGGLIADCALLASKRLWVPILTDVVLTTLMHLAVAHRHRLGAQGLSVYFWAHTE